MTTPSPAPEPWPRIYQEAPEIFEAFGRAEDPDGLIARRLWELAGLAGRRVLEIGCGTGRYTREWMGDASDYVALEPSSGMLGLARQAAGGAAVHWVEARGEALPFKENTFNRVLATWVLAYLRPETCTRVIQQALRVLRPEGNGGIWLVENHWTGAFQELRGREGLGGEPGVRRLLDDHGFRVADVIETELRFNSGAEALHILGSLCGPGVAERLKERPLARIGHNVVILHRSA